MNIIKVRFTDQNGNPKGRPYTYETPVEVAVGDLVQINEKSQGIVDEIGVSEKDLGFSKSLLKAIKGKVEPECKSDDACPIDEKSGDGA